MDRLSDLPTHDTNLTPEESEVINKMFDGAGSDAPKSKPQNVGWMQTLKLAGLSAGLFMLLANPWIDMLLCKLPYCEEGGLIIPAIKGLIFLLLWIIMFRYLA